MDKKVIKAFAIDARNKLRENVKYQMNIIGISENGILEPSQKDNDREIYDFGGSHPKILYKDEIEQRNSLINAINGEFDLLVEEVAYTWFNRIIAIRFMEVNDYLPIKVRVLSSETPDKIEPDIINDAPNVDLNFTDAETKKIYSLKNENKMDELFQFLFIKQCNQLKNILPELFETTKDYSELLLSISFTKENGVIRELINNIPEDDFKNQVEIIGWLYQYYNTELKDDTFKKMKKGVKISKKRIPAATQLFTPDWIVKYMVENSLGRLWVEGHPNTQLKDNWKYYLDEAPQETNVQKELEQIKEEYKNLKLEDIKVIDPCMGSGHILTYIFDILMEIYLSQGYNKKDATISILKNNIYGLDIDDRAYQLAYFAMMMKARSYYPQIFEENIELNLSPIKESNKISNELINHLSKDNPDLKRNIQYIKDTFKDAKNYGSLVNVKKLDYDKILTTISNFKIQNNLKYFFDINISLKPLIKQAQILSKKYNVVITNPPYLNKMNSSLRSFVKTNYKDYSKDLFSIFIYKNLKFCLKNGYTAFMAPFVWMFIVSYEKLREYLINEKLISSLIQLEYSAFADATVPLCTFVLRNSNLNFKGTYLKLSDFMGGMDIQGKKVLESVNCPVDYKYFTEQKSFSNIPGTPIAYWIEPELINAFKNGKKLSSLADVGYGLVTRNNNRFLRLWHEVNINKIGFNIPSLTQAKKSNKKWFPHNKGGSFRKWYGNHEYIINYENDGYELKNFKPSSVSNTSFYFKEGITYSDVTSGDPSFRAVQLGFIFDATGPTLFLKENTNYWNILGLLNSKIVMMMLQILAPTIHVNPGAVSKIPVVSEPNEKIKNIVLKCIDLSKNDWDNFETSWNFNINPLIIHNNINNNTNSGLISNAYSNWKDYSKSNFFQLKEKEETLNQIFIENYNMEQIISSKVSDNKITIRKADLKRDIKNLISYFVGCLFGRYSLDEEGLIFAGGGWNPLRYSKFVPDDDNIVPILDSEYFGDDIVNSFIGFLKVAFSEETLEENLKFISDALETRGKTYREKIRNYFLKDFYKDHTKMYKKTPIYWLFDSGKENGFKALIYMHRYNSDTVARVRTDYLHKTQKAIEGEMLNNEQILLNSANDKEKAQVTKNNTKLLKQLEETQKYDEALAHIANQQIDIDLDDGVKVNYAKFQGVEIADKKIDLLKKI